MAEFTVKDLEVAPYFDLELLMSTCKETRIDGDMMQKLAEAWDRWLPLARARHIEGNGESYLLAYLGDTRRLAPLDLLIAALAAGGMFFILASAGLGPLLLPVALYSLAIGAMLWRALARIGVVPPRSAWLAAGGAGVMASVLFSATSSFLRARLPP